MYRVNVNTEIAEEPRLKGPNRTAKTSAHFLKNIKSVCSSLKFCG